MQANKIFRALILAGLIVLGASFAAIPVRAADPPPGSSGGLPWTIQTPWPTARPLKPGESFSPGVMPPAPAATAPRVPPARNPVVSQIFVTPVPTVTRPPIVPPVIVLPAAPVATPLPTSTPTPVPVVVSAPAPVAPVPATSGSGDSATNPLNADGAWRALNGGASVWYRVGSGGQHMDVTLEASIISVVNLDVFAPDNYQRPIGRGTDSKNVGILAWGGGHWRSAGNWLARITNTGPATVQYKLTSSANDMSNRSCFSYWENIGASRVYWTECNHE